MSLPLDSAWARFHSEDLARPASRSVRLHQVLRTNVLSHNVSPSTVSLAAEIADLGSKDSTIKDALTALITVMLIDATEGSTRTPFTGPIGIEHLRRRLNVLLTGLNDRDRLIEAVLTLPLDTLPIVGPPKTRSPLILRDGWLHVQRTLHAETRLADHFRARLSVEAVETPQIEVKSTRLSDEQRAAVLYAATHPLTLISGGPGTGKTSLVVALIKVLLDQGIAKDAIALAAPTGKAAWRMGESVRVGLSTEDVIPAPRTLHRLLGYHPHDGRFRHHGRHPIPADVVIIDESSMIDVYLMERLLSALRPTAQLVLLGDANQLPSVSAGAVFRDILAVSGDAQRTLTHSYRVRSHDPAGQAILTVADRIQRGDPEVFDTLIIRTDPHALTNQGVELLVPAPLALRRVLDTWFTAVRGGSELRVLITRTWTAQKGLLVDDEDLAPLIAHQNQRRILCVTRGNDTGADAINALLHSRAAQADHQPSSIPFLTGEPVMVLHNDYERGLFNGDQGVVLWVTDSDGPRPMAVFPGLEGNRAFPLEALRGTLDLCYAMTVHKSQGSEFDQVLIRLPDEDIPLMTRELLYTALTRARSGVCFVGTPTRLRDGIERRVERFSTLADLLQ